MGIPGVVQMPGIVEKVSEHQLILVDGLRGHVVVDPAGDTRVRFETEMKEHQATLVEAKKHSHQPAITTDGVGIPVMANVGNRQDAELAAENGADGIGLYRTEILSTSRQMLPTEDELVPWQARGSAPVGFPEVAKASAPGLTPQASLSAHTAP